jgi:uncharacterized membrane protein
LRRHLLLAALITAVLAWNAALHAAPAGKPVAIAALTYLAGSMVCHQSPERSFHSNGAQYPVCARCLGLYTGAMFGLAAWLLVRCSGSVTRGVHGSLRLSGMRAAIVIAALPTLVTVALAWSGVWDAPNLVRALLAVPLGASIAAAAAAVASGDLR